MCHSSKDLPEVQTGREDFGDRSAGRGTSRCVSDYINKYAVRYSCGFIFLHVSNNTVVDRRSEAVNHAFGSDSEAHGIDDAFAIGTNAEDAQCRAILATAGG
jgi:hypothetical protein